MMETLKKINMMMKRLFIITKTENIISEVLKKEKEMVKVQNIMKKIKLNMMEII